MRQKETQAMSGYWPETIEELSGRETPENPKTILLLFFGSFALFPFFLPVLVTWMFWWFK